MPGHTSRRQRKTLGLGPVLARPLRQRLCCLLLLHAPWPVDGWEVSCFRDIGIIGATSSCTFEWNSISGPHTAYKLFTCGVISSDPCSRLFTVSLEHARALVVDFSVLALVFWLWDVPPRLPFFSKSYPELALRK